MKWLFLSCFAILCGCDDSQAFHDPENDRIPDVLHAPDRLSNLLGSL